MHESLPLHFSREIEGALQLESYFLTLAYLAIGASAGFLGGLLGVGGGVVVVPALIFIFESTGQFSSPTLPPNVLVLFATGTSMASIIFTTGSSAVAQMRRRNIDWSLVQIWMPMLVIGAFASSYIAKFLPIQLLKGFIATFLIFVAAVLLFDKLPHSKHRKPRIVPTALVASTGGLVSGMVGIGGGNVVVPSLLYFNTPVLRAAAVASTCGFGVSVSGALGYFLNGSLIEHPWTLGFIYLPALLPIAIGNTICAPIGVHFAHRVPAERLKRIFGGMMCVVSLYMFYSLVSG